MVVSIFSHYLTRKFYERAWVTVSFGLVSSFFERVNCIVVSSESQSMFIFNFSLHFTACRFFIANFFNFIAVHHHLNSEEYQHRMNQYDQFL